MCHLNWMARYQDLDRSQILTSAVGRLSMATRLSTITEIVAEAARALTGADGATFVLKEDDRCYYVDEDSISPLWKGHKFPISACISGWCMTHQQVVAIRDISTDPRIPQDVYRPTFVKSLCLVPIRIESPIGAIGNYWSHDYNPTPEDIKVLQILANSTSVALQNLELKQNLQLQSEKSAGLKNRADELELAMHSVAHDLRSPVAAMTGLAELMLFQLPANTDPTFRLYVQSLLETGRQTALQIEKMLALYQVTKGKMEPQKLNLSEMAKQVCSRLRLQVPNQKINAEIENDMTTFGDPSLIHLVLENLLSNAVKYSSKKPETEIQIGRTSASAELSTFFIRDNGQGFDPSHSHKLFRPLGRLHSEQEFPGTGLGLASVARIIEMHGGSVRAEAVKLQGAVFYFSLPEKAVQARTDLLAAN